MLRTDRPTDNVKTVYPPQSLQGGIMTMCPTQSSKIQGLFKDLQ